MENFSSATQQVSPFTDPRLTMLTLRMGCRVQREVIWNSFPGSVVHGVLGMTLKRRVCVKLDGICATCFLLHNCSYSRMILSPTPPDTERMRKYPSMPTPLRILVQPWEKSSLGAGEEMVISFVFVGRSVGDWSQVLLSIEESFQEGIGRKGRNGERGCVKALWIEDGISGIRKNWNELNFSHWGQFESHKWSDLLYDGSSDRLVFHTPVRIVSHGKVQSHPTLRDLVANLFRRLSSLAYFHCGVPIDVDYKRILDQIEPIVDSPTLTRMSAARYSGRQKRRLQMDGMRGIISLAGVPMEALPWIKLGSHFGVGKGTSMGWGGYSLS